MITRRLIGLLFLAVAGIHMPATAAIVYDNLGSSGNTGGLQSFGNGGAAASGGVADDFILQKQTILESFRFYTLEASGGWDNVTVSVAILGDNAGKPDNTNILFGANLPGSILSKMATGHTTTLGGGTVNEFLWEVSLPDIDLNAGKYWFSLYFGYFSSNIYWAYGPTQLNDPASVYFIAGGDWFATPVDVSLELNGITIPTPSTALLIVLTLGLMGTRRLRKSL